MNSRDSEGPCSDREEARNIRTLRSCTYHTLFSKLNGRGRVGVGHAASFVARGKFCGSHKVVRRDARLARCSGARHIAGRAPLRLRLAAGQLQVRGRHEPARVSAAGVAGDGRAVRHRDHQERPGAVPAARRQDSGVFKGAEPGEGGPRVLSLVGVDMCVCVLRADGVCHAPNL